MKGKKQKFQAGDFVWIKKWHYEPITPQIGIYMSSSGNNKSVPHEVYVTNCPFKELFGPNWFFRDGEIRKATFKESEAYLKTIIKP